MGHLLQREEKQQYSIYDRLLSINIWSVFFSAKDCVDSDNKNPISESTVGSRSYSSLTWFRADDYGAALFEYRALYVVFVRLHNAVMDDYWEEKIEKS